MGAQIQSHSLSTLALCNLSEIMKFFHLKSATLKWMAFAWYCAHRGARGIGMVRGRERERESLYSPVALLDPGWLQFQFFLGGINIYWNGIPSPAPAAACWCTRSAGVGAGHFLERIQLQLKIAFLVWVSRWMWIWTWRRRTLDSTHRLLLTNCIRLASTSSSREWESHCRYWAKSMLDRLMHCLNFAYGATAAASPTPTSTRTRTRTRVIQSISSSPTITNSASRQLRNNFTHCSHTQPELNAGNASLPARSSQLRQRASCKFCLALSFQSEALSN